MSCKRALVAAILSLAVAVDASESCAATLPSTGLQLQATANVSIDPSAFFRPGEEITIRFDLRPEDLRRSTARPSTGWSFLYVNNPIPVHVSSERAGEHPTVGVIGRLLATSGASTMDQIRVDVLVGNEVVPVITIPRTLDPTTFPLSIEAMLGAIRQSIEDPGVTPINADGMLLVDTGPGPGDREIVRFVNARWSLIPEPGTAASVMIATLPGWFMRRKAYEN